MARSVHRAPNMTFRPRILWVSLAAALALAASAVALERERAPRDLVLLEEIREPWERRQPELSIGTNPANGVPHVRLAGRGMRVPPTLDLLCPGKRVVLTLSRSDHVEDRAVAVYDLPATVVQAALRSPACELWVVGAAIPVRREILDRAWGGTPPARTVQELASGRVLQVTGADTLRVAIGERVEDIRYRGIETRATHLLTPGRDAGGRAALAVARRLAEGKVVRLDFEPEERDGDGRRLAWVWSGDVLINAELVRQGLAKVTLTTGRHVDAVQAAQREAQRAGRGMWAGHPAVPRPPAPAVATAATPRPGTDPDSDGVCPVEQPIKGSIGSDRQCVFHAPGGFFYGMTRPQRCYSTQDEALRDGCRGSRL